ncbi:hypothetical protein UR09_02280 [Candidatus Nitromaritima sp. SCGC AAA799-A02]|nr:hypothetical protein UR09_02280 [Candidatus Nitromaritima sp. SCGC AAA799-A02]
MSEKQESGKWTRAKIRKFLGPFLAVAGLLYTYRSHLNDCPHAVIFAAWAVLPPVWFILEYRFLFDRNRESSIDFEAFKHSQTLARNLWVGFLAFLAAFYLGNWNG